MDAERELQTRAINTIRFLSVDAVQKANSGHPGLPMGTAAIAYTLWAKHLKINPENPKWEDRDRFLLSKGHACTSLYATLALKGFFPLGQLSTYGQDGSDFVSHTSHKIPGIEISAGSLGHALPIGCGIALAAKKKNKNFRTFVLVSDGELDEGSNWEAILFAPQHKLDNLILIVDYNKIQSLGNVKDVLDLEPLKKKFEAFNWECSEIDGHNHKAIYESLATLELNGRPKAIIAHTIKGKGIDFMENKLLWHYKSPSEKEYIDAISQITSKE